MTVEQYISGLSVGTVFGLADMETAGVPVNSSTSVRLKSLSRRKTPIIVLYQPGTGGRRVLYRRV